MVLRWKVLMFKLGLQTESSENMYCAETGVMHFSNSLHGSHQTAIFNNREAGTIASDSQRMKLSKESILLISIGALDLISTLIWVGEHGAQEANPIFQHYLEMGPVWFAVMKIVMLAAPIYLLEWARRRRPVFTRLASRFAVCAYLTMYVVGVAKLNPQLFQPKPQHMALAFQDGMDFGSLPLGDGSVRDYKAGSAQQYNDSTVVGEGMR